MIDEFWTITSTLLEYLKQNLPEGKTILELGSGKGTEELVKNWKVSSIEHDSKWVGVVPQTNYIHAPLTPHKALKRHEGTLWYDRRVLTEQIVKSNLQYDLILVDGPCPPGSRAGFFKYIDYFNTNVPLIFDDINRAKDWILLLSIQNKLGKTITVPHDSHGKAFGVLS